MRVFFLLWFVLELFAFFCVAEWIGFGWAILLLLLPMVFGGAIMRWQGMHLIRKMQRMQQAGQLAHLGMGVLDGIAMAFAGILLIIPGFITTVIALLLLIPPFRMILMKPLWNKALRKFSAKAANTPHFTQPSHAETPKTPKTPSGRIIDHESGKEVK